MVLLLAPCALQRNNCYRLLLLFGRKGTRNRSTAKRREEARDEAIAEESESSDKVLYLVDAGSDIGSIS